MKSLKKAKKKELEITILEHVEVELPDEEATALKYKQLYKELTVNNKLASEVNEALKGDVDFRKTHTSAPTDNIYAKLRKYINK